MAFNNGNSSNTTSENSEITLSVDGPSVELPDASFVRDADISRDGSDLVLEGPDGTIVIEGYYAADPQPDLVAPDGATLSPELVESFSTSSSEYASTMSMSDESPVGTAHEVSGNATVTRADGSIETINMGTSIYQGDIIETDADGAVNIVFVDETSFAVSEDARLAIDEYVFDPATQSGSQNFSVLKGVFVFTSGLIGRDDPDDVEIDTPVGSIGIRGTSIAGDVDTGEITVIEGAIVLTDNNGFEMTLATQFETAKFSSNGNGIENQGQMSAADIGSKFASIAQVSPSFFSSINDAALESKANGEEPTDNVTTGPGQNLNGEPINTQFGLENSSLDLPSSSGASITGGAPPLPGGENPPPPQFGGDQPPPGGDGNQPPPPPPPGASMSLINSTAIIENNSSGTFAAQNVLTLNLDSGLISSASQVTLSGAFSNLFDLSYAGGTQFNVSLKSDVQNNLIDFDTLSYNGLIDSFGATIRIVDNFSQVTTQFFTVNVTDINEAPRATVAQPPNEYFAAGEESNWSYYFDKSIVDPDFLDEGLGTFSMSNIQLNGGTVYTNLDSFISSIENTVITTGSFDSTNGYLNLDIGNLTNDEVISPDDYITFNISLTDDDGESNTESYTFNLFSESAFDIINGTELMLNTNGQTSLGTSGGDEITIGMSGAANNNIVLMGDGNDTATILNGSNNTINLGDGNNTVTISSSNAPINNTIIGGFDQDTFAVNNVSNYMYGMDGDDDFIIDFTLTNTGDLQSNSLTGLIDGGLNNFRAGSALDGIVPKFFGESTYSHEGRGDSLVLQNAGDLNFTLINNAFIKGIERIDADNSAANTLTLNYIDVLEMTDPKSALIINLDGNDTLILGNGFTLGSEAGQFQKIADNEAINDARAGYTEDLKDYDIFTNGVITLLINDSSNGSADIDFGGQTIAI